MKHVFEPKGVCSRRIHLELEGGVVRDVSFEFGCDGNAQGVSQLAKGRKAEEVIGILQGICCGDKDTSCPDQLARALSAAIEREKQAAGGPLKDE